MQVDGRGSEYDVVHLECTSEQSLAAFLSTELSLPANRIDELLWLGAVYVNDQRSTGQSDAEEPLGKGFRIRVHLQPRRYFKGPLTQRIVEADSDYYLVDKPGGLPTHAMVDNAQENLITLLSRQLQEKLYITHRLDTETSGLIIVARNAEAQAKINDLIKDRKVKREYEAWTVQPIKPGRYIHFMEPSPKAPKIVSKDKQDGWQDCELVIQSCEPTEYTAIPVQAYTLKIQLVTGRSQQIRAQLAELGSPIIGDSQYGSEYQITDPLTGAKCIGLRASKVGGLELLKD
ncbi:MAG: pseudouridine synthase [Bdellovibrionota bacterium]